MPERVHTKFDEAKASPQPVKADAAKVKSAPPKAPNDAGVRGTKRSRSPSADSNDNPRKKSVPSSLAKSQPNAPPKDTETASQPTHSQATKVLSKSKQRDGKNAPSLKTSPMDSLVGHGSKAKNNATPNGGRRFAEEAQKTEGPRPSPEVLKRTAKLLLKDRELLPIWKHKVDIRWTLRHQDILLLVGETGSGKSTQVPQFLISEPWCRRQEIRYSDEQGQDKKFFVGGRIAITQPRRVAATTLARRVAAETGSYLAKHGMTDADKVGYSVRFDTTLPPKAQIEFLTEGMLLQKLLHDPHLRQYSAVIIDEVHERSVDVDLLLGFLKNLVMGDKRGRGGVPLRLVVMSATASMKSLRDFFIQSPTATVNEKDNTIDHDIVQTDLHSGPEVDAEGSQPPSVILRGVSGEYPSPPNSAAHNRSFSNSSESSWEGIESDNDAKPKPPKTAAEKAQSGNKITAAPQDIQPKATPAVGELQESAPAVDDKRAVTHYIEGRQHPVQIFYSAKPVEDYVEVTIKTIFKVHIEEKLPGDILVFLTGQEEIEDVKKTVEDYAMSLDPKVPRMVVLPLYGHQTNEQQQRVFAPIKGNNTRKVVLATNIAETSVTVPGVRYVIDCGKAKIKHFRPKLNLQSLLVKDISKSSAIQRKGRAGREAPGQCYRLYTEKDYLDFEDADVPEILRSDVAHAILRMKARGVEDIMSFPLLDYPDVDVILRALDMLVAMEALVEKTGELTDIGLKMAQFPLPVKYSRVLVEASGVDQDCLLDAIDVVSCLTDGEDIFMQAKSDDKREEVEAERQDLKRREGDILVYLTAMQKYASENVNRAEWCQKRMISSRNMKTAMSVRKQLQDHCIQQKMLKTRPPPDPQPFLPTSEQRAIALLKCFLSAFVLCTATLQPDGSYSTLDGKQTVNIHPSSSLHGKKTEAIMFLENVFTQKNYVKKVSRVQADWILETLERSKQRSS
jgi:ATP-dependent RNA helicase DHR2